MMEAFALYLLKSAIWLSGFALIYFLFLRNERFFVLKRIYLISGILISLIFPFVSVHYQVEIPVPEVQAINISPVTDTVITSVQQESSIETPYYKYILLFLYLTGVLFFAFRLVIHLISLYKTIRRAKIDNCGFAKLITTSEFSSSFSFFNYIFINPSLSKSEMEQIMNHELVHVQQKHWFDLLIIELLRLIQWINPFAWIYTGFIRTNHEYMADEQALQRANDPAVYKVTLLNQMFSSPVISLSNSFNYSINKKRFDMMKKIITSPYRKMKLLLILPVIAAILYAFAKPEYDYIYPEEQPVTDISVVTTQEREVKGTVIQEDGRPLPGAIVVASGTILGASADSKGYFIIKGIPEDGELVISFVGFKTKVVKPDFTSEMKIMMIMDTIKLERKSKTTTPSPQRSSSENVFERKKPSPIFSIHGEGTPPIYVINGKVTPANEAKLIDNESIESVTVMKNRESVELYGGKNESGVILINTRNKKSELPDSTVNAPDLNPPPPPPSETDKVSDKPLSIPLSLDVKGDFILTEDKYLKIRSHDGKTPPVFIDGVETDIKRTRIDPETIESIRVYRAGTGVDKFGERGKNEIIEIITRRDGSLNNGKRPISFEIVKTQSDQAGSSTPFVVVEEMPEFAGGGEDAMFEWIAQNLRYPVKARKKKIEGTVRVKFLINPEGKVSDVVILRSDNKIFEDEAKRLVSNMPDWKPGRQSGKAVSVYYMVPVEFRLTAGKESIKPSGKANREANLPYSITRRNGIISSDISKVKDEGNEVIIKYLEGGQLVRTNYTIYNSSGRRFNSGSKTGFENVNFPFELKVNKSASDMKTGSRFDINFECIINEPGKWEVTIKAGAEAFPMLQRDEEKVPEWRR